MACQIQRQDEVVQSPDQVQAGASGDQGDWIPLLQIPSIHDYCTSTLLLSCSSEKLLEAAGLLIQFRSAGSREIGDAVVVAETAVERGRVLVFRIDQGEGRFRGHDFGTLDRHHGLEKGRQFRFFHGFLGNPVGRLAEVVAGHDVVFPQVFLLMDKFERIVELLLDDSSVDPSPVRALERPSALERLGSCRHAARRFALREYILCLEEVPSVVEVRSATRPFGSN